MKLFATVVSFILMLAYSKDLRFNKNGKFKIVQFTDIHFGENDKDDAANQ